MDFKYVFSFVSATAGFVLSIIAFLLVFSFLLSVLGIGYRFIILPEIFSLFILFVLNILFSYIVARRLDVVNSHNLFFSFLLLLLLACMVDLLFFGYFLFEIFLSALVLVYMLFNVVLLLNSSNVIMDLLAQTLSKSTAKVLLTILAIIIILGVYSPLISGSSYEPRNISMYLSEDQSGLIMRVSSGSGCGSSGFISWNYHDINKTFEDIKLLNAHSSGACDMVTYVTRRHELSDLPSINESHDYKIYLQNVTNLIRLTNSASGLVLEPVDTQNVMVIPTRIARNFN